MSQLKVYGTPMSRAARTLWMCRELGLPFEKVPVQFADGSTKTPEYLAINPNGRIPAIQDGDFTLYESMAINLYLARKHPGPLTPATPADEARAWQWSFWVMTEVEKPQLNVLLQRHGAASRSPRRSTSASGAEGREEGERAAAELPSRSACSRASSEAAVARRRQLHRHRPQRRLGVRLAQLANIDLARWPRIAEWLDRCMARLAFRDQAQERRAAG